MLNIPEYIIIIIIYNKLSVLNIVYYILYNSSNKYKIYSVQVVLRSPNTQYSQTKKIRHGRLNTYIKL